MLKPTSQSSNPQSSRPLDSTSHGTKVLFTITDLEKMIDVGIFDQRNERIEFIEGEFRKMSPASDHHDNLIRALNMWSVRHQTNGLFDIAVQMGIRLTQTESMPEPDLYWVKAGRTERPTTAVVPLIIEVSAASLEYDRTSKSRLYALDNLQEYWIVNIESQCIEVRRQPVDGNFSQEAVFGRSDTIHPTCLESAKLDIDQLFRSAGLL